MTLRYTGRGPPSYSASIDVAMAAIAVSILAELVQLRAAGELKPRARTMLTVIEPAEVIDLVCGMTVQAVPANRPFDFEGATYYFCAMGCRVAFEKDPRSFIQQEAPC